MSDVLTWKTAVEFVLGENPGGGGITPQTGDILSIILAILFGLLAVGSIALFAYSRRKASVTYGNYLNPKDVLKPKLSKFALGALIISILAIICSLVFPAFQRAVASNDSNADETIKAYVDTQAGTVTCDVANIVNNNESDVYISSVQVDLTEEAKEVLKETKFNLKIESEDLGITLYDKEVPGVMDQLKSFPFVPNQTVKASLSFANLDFATAKLLIGKSVLDITFGEKPCYSVKYNSNGAKSGTTPSPQVKEAGVAVTLASKPDFVKDGYTLQDYWTTDPSDGPSATHYDFGGEYTADASITLYAAWKQNPVPGKYNVTFTCGEGGSITSGSDFTVDDGVVYNYTDVATSPTVHSLSFSADGQETHTITVTAGDGYTFDKWTVNGSSVTEGTVSSSTAFVANFTNVKPKTKIQVTYKIPNTNFVHGHVQLLKDGSTPVTTVSEEVSVEQQGFTGAKAVELEKNEANKFSYFWYHWTIEGVDGKSYVGKDLTREMIAKEFGYITDDVTFIAHFATPVAKYTETNSTMVFSCEDHADEDDDFIFPVNNTHWDDNFNWKSATLHLLTLPSWCNYDGTQKVYPRTVKFLPSFKAYEGLTSTSLWFNTEYLLSEESTLGKHGFISGPVMQERVLSTVTGLENIYTTNIEETAMMFRMPNPENSNIVDNLTSIDLSSWNLCPKDESGVYKPINMYSMFYGCRGLKNIILPNESEGHYFGTHASNLSSMFESCSNLKNIELNGNFGKDASTIKGMFRSCYSLTNVCISGGFGEKATNMQETFANCYNLKELSFGPTFGGAATNLNGLFNNCSQLRNLNFGTNSQFGNASQSSVEFDCSHMLRECNSLRSIDLSNFKLSTNENIIYDEMLLGLKSLSEFTISDKWNVNMSSVGLHDVDESNQWAKEYNPESSYPTNSIPDRSGYGTFSLTTAKAIYDPNAKTFTFVYDCANYSSQIESGCTVFPVNGKTGYVTGMLQANIDNSSVWGKLIGFAEDAIFSAGKNPFGPSILILNQSRYYDISNLELPAWYSFDPYTYKIKCLIDQDVTVQFDWTFKDCPDIYSTSCWFMADSYDNAPFIEFCSKIGDRKSRGFDNLPANNIETCASMFGGFCYEAYKHHNYWYNRSDADISLMGARQSFDDLKSQVSGVYISSYLDTYNTKLTSLDLSTFNIGNKQSCDYGAICANCKSLTNVSLPSNLSILNEEDNSFENPTDNVGSYCSFACAFYGCEKLTTITDIEIFNPFLALSKRKLNYGSYAIGRMFYGCKSLTSLDLSSFALRPYLEGVFSDMYTYQDVFCGCELLNKLTLSENWDLPMTGDGAIDLGTGREDKLANLPVYDTAGIYWNFTPKDPSVEPQQNLTTIQVPYNTAAEWQERSYNAGTYVRDASAVGKLLKTINIGVDSPEKGSVSDTSYKFYNSSNPHGDENLQEISCNSSSLWINDTKIIATPNDGYIFSYWTIEIDGNTNILDSNNDQYINKGCKIVAHFMHSDWTAKAVYKKNDTKYDGHNTMNFYFDNLDHSSEGEVFPIDFNSRVNNKGEYRILLPSWYTLTYVARSDIWATKDLQNGLEGHNNPVEVLKVNESMMDYNPFDLSASAGLQTKYIKTYSSLWRIQTLVEPEDVVFDKSFKEYTQLRSISMWFMGDMFGTQTVKNFYSPTDDNDRNPGFANMFTGNLNDVSYAFGGLFEKNKKKRISGEGRNSKAQGHSQQLWAGDTETYGTSIESLDLTGFDFSNVRNLAYMFTNCVALKNIKFDSSLDTSKNEYLTGTFCNCENLGPKFSDCVQNWDKFTTDNVAFFDGMFYGCSGIEELDLSKFITEKAVYNEKYENYGTMGASGMFNECTRLSKITVTSSYVEDVDQFNVKGWGLNLGYCDLEDCKGEAKWILEDSTAWTETDSSFMIPYNSNIIESGKCPTEEQIFSGTFYRSESFDEMNVEVKSNDTSKGTVSESGYGYINNVQIKLDNLNDNCINLDNRKIVATPTDENSRFAYWKLNVEGDETIVDNLTIPTGYCETFESYDNPEITITAVFISNDDNAYVAFSNHENGGDKEGAFTFYYGKGSEEEASKLIPDGDNLIEIFSVDKNSNDYDLPSWYRKYQESWISGDNHPIPKFVSKIESNAKTISINFDESFKNFEELRSMSCWFMGAIQAADETNLYNPFILGTAEEPLDFSNVNTSNINNVAYMFGGHEFFNDIHGSKNEIVNISNFDKEGNITNLSGLFANLPRLKTLKVDDASFKGMANVTNTSKMFYNTDILDKGNLTWLKTDKVTNMSYMFARTSDGKPEVEPTGEYTIILPEGFRIVKDLILDLNLQGMFSGYDNYKSLIVDFSNLPVQTGDNFKGKECNLSYMFQNCYWVRSIEFVGDSKVPTAFSSGTNMSYMYQNCQKLKKITDDASCIPNCFKEIDKVTDFSHMFDGCISLEEYSLTREDWIVITSTAFMFADCPALKTVEMNSGYYWNSDFGGPYNMFTNSDGSLNTTLEHLKLDVFSIRDNYYDEYLCNFYDMGLSRWAEDDTTIGWINHDTLYFNDSYNMPDWDYDWSDEDTKVIQFDRASKYSYVNYPICPDGVWDAGFSFPSSGTMLPSCYTSDAGQRGWFIGFADGYKLETYVGEVQKESDTYWKQDVFFKLSYDDSASDKFALYGVNEYASGDSPVAEYWLQDVANPATTNKIEATIDNPLKITASKYVWFPAVPNEYRPLAESRVEAAPAQEAAPATVAQVAEPEQENLSEQPIEVEIPVQDVAETVLSVFVMPMPWTLLNMVLAIFA